MYDHLEYIKVFKALGDSKIAVIVTTTENIAEKDGGCFYGKYRKKEYGYRIL